MENTGPPPSDGNRDIASSTIVAQAVTLTLAFILVSLRLFVKVRIIHKYGLDDWFVVLGLVSRYSALYQSLNLQFNINNLDILHSPLSPQYHRHSLWSWSARLLRAPRRSNSNCKISLHLSGYGHCLVDLYQNLY